MDENEQAEYLEEIADLRSRLARLVEEGGDPVLIDEFTVELRILEALLLAAREVQQQLRLDSELGEGLSARGFSPHSFKEVYAFVYDSAMEIELGGRELARAVSETDFVGLLSS
ncbi:MAG TPA: hypothetical protein VNF75_02090 [Candidatus Dormibacteraeota bacterium]|nr:hypothetical protein [Candidatus Dormibacteraeota bacterium]